MSSEIQKKQALPGSAMPVAKGARDGDGKKIKPLPPKAYDAAGEIKKFGLKPTELLEYRDPITDEKKSIMIDRRGTNDETLALTLLDPNLTRERKDTAISMYLFEAGKQGASMLMDLWMYKGAHTKESRQFQSTMRFDFELFLSVFQDFMAKSASLFLNNLPIKLTEVEVEEDGKKFKKEIVETTRDVTANEIAIVLGQYAQYYKLHADLLGKRIRQEVDKRERAKGKGIYIGMDNKPYSVHEDADIVEVVAKDKASADAQKNGDAH